MSFRRTVASELTLWLSIITTIIAFVLGGVYTYVAARSVTTRLITEANRTADELSQVLVSPLFNFDQTAAQEIANIYLRSGRVKGLFITAEGMGEVFNNHVKTLSSLPRLSRKIVKDDTQIGSIELIFNDNQIALAKNRALKTTFFTVLLLLLLYTLSLSFILRHILVKPLAGLGERLQALVDGSFSGRLTPLPQKDLNTIVIAANRMFEEISSQTKTLRENERNYREIYNATSDAIFIHNLDGTLLDVNQTMLDMYGYTRNEIHTLGEGALSGESPFGPKERRVMVARALAEGPQLFKWRARKKDGSFFWVEVALKEARLGNQQVVLAFVSDISQREQLEEQLRQAQRMEAIGMLAGGIAHDFNNILSAILGYTELSLKQVDDSSKTFGHLKQVERASLRARELVRQILTFSRKQEPKKEVLPLAAVVSEAMNLMRSSMPVTVKIVQHLDSHSLVEVDASQIHQVILNICTNGFQAMPESSGTLVISLNDITLPEDDNGDDLELPAGKYVILAIEDNGSGMEKAVLDRIFDPYFTTRKSERGTGLGLSVVQGIVKKHQGKILVESVPDKGTVFRLIFPVTGKPRTLGGVHTVTADYARGQRIIVVDDEESIRHLMKEILTQAGYDVEVFADGLSAWQTISTFFQEIDLLITDLTMPGLTGIELFRKVRAVRSDLPVILCTGYNEMKDSFRGEDVSACLQKPVTVQELLLTTAKVLKKREDTR